MNVSLYLETILLQVATEADLKTFKNTDRPIKIKTDGPRDRNTDKRKDKQTDIYTNGHKKTF
jgi:hypothetical protein